jgi:hypothetical protein
MVLGASGYEPDFEIVRAVQAVKRRFLAEYGDELRDRKEIEAASRRWARRNLAEVIRRRLARDASTRDLAALVRDAARVEPTILSSRELAKLTLERVCAA